MQHHCGGGAISSEDDIQDDDEERRREIERLVLVLALLGPLVLAVFSFGLYRLVDLRSVHGLRIAANWLAVFGLSISASLALLLVWRVPTVGKSIWKPAAAVMTAIVAPAIITLLNAGQLSSLTLPHLLIVVRDVWVHSMFVLIGGVAISLFLRRATGWCVAREVEGMPLQRPFSILELLGWITISGIAFASVPMIIPRAAYTSTLGLVSYLLFVMSRIVVLVLPLTFLILTSAVRWSRRILMAVIADAVPRLLAIALFVHFSRSPGWSASMAELNAISASVGGNVLVVWMAERRGYRCVRLSGRRGSSV